MEHLITFRALLLRVVLILSLSIPAASLVPTLRTCQEDEFPTEDGLCCTRCHPGTILVEQCHGPHSKRKCANCPNGQYMDKINYRDKCFTCSTCKDHHNKMQVSPCTRTKDAVCRCKDGYYKSEIDSRTYDCLECSKCGDNEKVVNKCSHEQDTECRCRDDYYRLNNKCLPCTNCTSAECSRDCPRGINGAPSEPHPFLINVITGAAVAVALTLVLVVVVTHFVTKRQTKKKLLSSQEYKESPEIYEEFTAHFEEPSDHSLHSQAPLHVVISQEPSNLPDFIPLEIKIPDVIYTLLDSVPVLQVKQLVRSLGVSDSVIERAELDHRSSKEAQYQMLRAWAEQGIPGKRGGMLHLPLLHQLLDKLRLMHLEQTAQELETKYNLL